MNIQKKPVLHSTILPQICKYRGCQTKWFSALSSPRHIAPFISVTIENSTCDIFSATIGTLFLCCVRVVNQNTRALLLVFVVFTQCDVCRQSPTFQHKHNIRRDTRKKNDKIDESSKIERMI